MSKAEKFIQENTRNCSNLMQVPTLDDKGNIVPEAHPWLTPNEARKAVEIARAEIFDKIKFYIESMVSDITFSDIDGNDNYDLNKFIEDLKQAIKDE